MAFSLKEGACLLTLACLLSPAACFTTSLPSPLRCSAAERSSEQQTRHVSRSAVLRNLLVSASLWGGIPRRAGALSLQAQDSSPFAAVYDAVGRWLADHPAPLWLVNNPVKKWLATSSAGDYDQANTRETLENLVSLHDIVVFSATYCPFSLAAKRTLAAQGVPFQVYEWNTRPDGAALVAELGVVTGRTSIPHIFVGGKSIGGFNDGTPGLRPLIASGEFGSALEEAKRRRAAGSPSSNLSIYGSP